MRCLIALLPLLAIGAAPPQAAPTAGIRLGDIRVQLYYKDSGTLSGDVAEPSRSKLWNSPVGEGDAKEAADDALVSVGLSGDTPDTVTDLPLIVTAKIDDTILATRSFTVILVPIKGQAWSALWLPDVTCKNKVTIDASYGDQHKSTWVNFACGD